MKDKNERDISPLPPPPSLPLEPIDVDPVAAGSPSSSIIEQLANLADKSEVMSLLEFKEEQQLDKNDPYGHFFYSSKLLKIRLTSKNRSSTY